MTHHYEITTLEQQLGLLVTSLATGSFAEVIATCHVSMMEGIARNFDRRVDSSGAQWPARKDKKTHPLLRLSNAMFASIANLDGNGQINRVSDREGQMGIDLNVIPYARAQNLGHTYNVKGRTWVLPPREYAYLTDERVDMLGELIADFAIEEFF